jgi:hypothetical protein
VKFSDGKRAPYKDSKVDLVWGKLDVFFGSGLSHLSEFVRDERVGTEDAGGVAGDSDHTLINTRDSVGDLHF